MLEKTREVPLGPSAAQHVLRPIGRRKLRRPGDVRQSGLRSHAQPDRHALHFPPKAEIGHRIDQHVVDRVNAGPAEDGPLAAAAPNRRGLGRLQRDPMALRRSHTLRDQELVEGSRHLRAIEPTAPLNLRPLVGERTSARYGTSLLDPPDRRRPPFVAPPSRFRPATGRHSADPTSTTSSMRLSAVAFTSIFL